MTLPLPGSNGPRTAARPAPDGKGPPPSSAPAKTACRLTATKSPTPATDARTLNESLTLMPSLDKHQSSEFTKLLLEGDSGSGKTGSLASLVAAGFKLRVLDMDNGLDSLANAVKRTCPDKLSGNVEFRTLRDKRRATPAGSCHRWGSSSIYNCSSECLTDGNTIQLTLEFQQLGTGLLACSRLSHIPRRRRLRLARSPDQVRHGREV
jgi:hypothetical protein